MRQVHEMRRKGGGRARRALAPLGAAAVAGALALSAASAAPDAVSEVPAGGIPAGMPATPLPSIKGCNGTQTAFLREAWRIAHFATWRARRVVDYVQSLPRDERPAVWERDYLPGDNWSPSPRRWFGIYVTEHASFVQEALQKADLRFRRQGKHVEGVKTLRCGQPLAHVSADTDVCPKGNPGGGGAPSAYHFPINEIVTCPDFWSVEGTRDERLWAAARVLVHELFHHLSVNGVYVKDRHADGVGGHKDKKYYGIDNVTYLAEKARSWAKRNNDSYAFFARGAAAAEARYAGVWSPKDAGGAAALYYDLTWDGLVKRWQELGAQGQYLADVETYVRDGKRRYLALWRRGAGNGALGAAPWTQFAAEWQRLKRTQDLIDVEVYRSGGEWRYIGVFRVKQGRSTGDGGLLRGLTTTTLVDQWKASGKVAHLVDVEAYGTGSGRRYVAVWRAGPGHGSLLLTTSWKSFEEYKVARNPHEELVDFEEYPDGTKRLYIGVWRTGGRSETMTRNRSRAALVDAWRQNAATKTLVDVEELSALPLRVP